MKERKHGYYWVHSKKNKAWSIAYWWPNLNKGKGAWDFPHSITGLVGTVIDKVHPYQIKPPQEDDDMPSFRLDDNKNYGLKHIKIKRVRTKRRVRTK